MTVVLTSRIVNLDPTDTPSLATFYLASESSPLFTYQATNDTSTWTFALSTWDVEPERIPLNAYPMLQHIEYDLTSGTMSGNCSPLPGSNTPRTPCLQGAFPADLHPPFTITSSAPLGTSKSTGSTLPTTVVLDTRPRDVVYDGTEPYVILRERDPAGALGPVVLRTAVQALMSCSSLKVCVAGSRDPTSGERQLVGAEVMASLGLLFVSHAEHALTCNRRPGSEDGR